MTLSLLVGHGQVLLAVAVEVPHRHGIRISPRGEVDGAAKVPLPVPSSIDDVVANEVGHGQVLLAVAVEVPHRHGTRAQSPRRSWTAAAKVPLPVPSSIDTLPLQRLATARSCLPSPLKSPTATEQGPVPR